MAHELDYSRKRGPSATLIVVVALLLTGAAVGGWFIYRVPKNAARPPQPPDYHFFYGRVVDQDGNPVAQAEVNALASELGDNAVIHGATAPVVETQKQLNAWTNQDGHFMLMFPGTYQELTIQEVIKPSHEWVFDWEWSTPWGDAHNNRFYRLAEPRNIGMPYQPDPDRPAIFPMHKIDHPGPASRPSRGGKDGRRINQPMELVVPSAGPDAPRTDVEIGQRIRDAAERQRQAGTRRVGP